MLLKSSFKKVLISLLFFISLFIVSISCDSSESLVITMPPPDLRKITLSVEDVSCTEMWLKIKTDRISLPAEIKLYKIVGEQTIMLTTKDTILYIDSLFPSQTYNYMAILSTDTKIRSEAVKGRTLDPTSQNFTWQTFAFGEHSNSVLFDVAIINENNIWAVGEIYMNDSLGNPDPKFYNLIKWDGIDWKPERIYFTNSQGQSFLAPMKSIFAFNTNDIWIGLDQLIHWDGNDYVEYELSDAVFQSWINKIWGSSSNDLYIVGGGGNIAHYNGSSWQKIESGTDLDFLDIYGADDIKTNEQQILAVCTRNYPLGKAIFKIDGNTAIQISSMPIQWELFSCWFVPNKHYYVVGSGIYEKSSLPDSVWRNEPLDITHYGTSKIRGNGINDVFVVGAFGEILHYNGFSWKSFLPELGTFNGSYGSLDIKGNLVAITGLESAKAKITLGIR